MEHGIAETISDLLLLTAKRQDSEDTMAQSSASLLVGACAGLVSALLSLSAGQPSLLSIFLLAAAALPVLIASLGWGNNAGIAAVLSAGLVIAIITGPMAALLFTTTTLVPSAWIGHLTTLARPAEEIGGPAGSVVWFPLSGILAQLCGLVTVGLVILGFAVGYGEEIVSEIVETFVALMVQQNPTYAPSEIGIEQMQQFFLLAMPAVQGSIWVLILFAAHYIACAIVRRSARMGRPKDDIPATLRMTRNSMFVFGAGLVLTFLPGVPALIGSALTGAYAAGFLMAGFAMLHDRTRGKSWRGLALSLCYVSVILFTLPIVLFLIAGLIDASRRSGRPDMPGNVPPANPPANT